MFPACFTYLLAVAVSSFQWRVPVTADQVHLQNTGAADSACWCYVLLDSTRCIMQVAGWPCIGPFVCTCFTRYTEHIFLFVGCSARGVVKACPLCWRHMSAWSSMQKL